MDGGDIQKRFQWPGGGGGEEKHEIYVVTFGSYLCYDLYFYRARGAMAAWALWIRHWYLHLLTAHVAMAHFLLQKAINVTV